MTTFSGAVLDEHVRLLEDAMNELRMHLANRGAVPDYATYCHKTGQIEGLRMALELCDEAIKRVNEK